MERELRESRDRLELVMEAGEHGFWDWKSAKNETFLSHTFYTMLGYRPGAIAQNIETIYKLVHPDDKKQLKKAIDGCMKTENTYDLELRFLCADGTYKWVSAKGKSYSETESSEAKRVVGVLVDIDRRRSAEDERATREKQFRLLFENSPMGIYIANTDGNIIDGNSRFA